MKKNLKKVISAIAALALSTSSFVALAQDFPDVAATADYATAVDQLTSLGIVTGYQDGTFGPDKLVTRAEITAMIIRALGDEAAAQSSAGLNTVYSDVTSNHWAAGYIAVATTSVTPFINGMGDGTFAPDANVTFAQATTMLVRAVGYEQYASQAGYPNGYLNYGAQLDITNGVAGTVGNDTELNRGQVAILIDNAVVDAPICVNGTVTYDAWGNARYQPEVMNGQGSGWETLLINKHDAYKVYGTVTSTKTSDPGLDYDEVRFKIDSAENFLDEYYRGGYSRNTGLEWTDVVNVGNTKAADYLQQYAEAIIQETRNDEYVLISFKPSGRSDTIEFEANDYVYDDTRYSDKTGAGAYKEGIFYVYANENQTSKNTYRLASSLRANADKADAVKWYVNGVEVTSFDEDKFNQFITNNEVGSIQLLDNVNTSGSATPDNYYDSVMISYYADVVVRDVQTNTSMPRIVFENVDTKALPKTSYLNIELDDRDKTYNFYLRNEDGTDTAISYEDIQPLDIISFMWNGAESGQGLEDSDVVTGYVSRNTASGRVTSTSADNGYQMNSTYYEPNANLVDDPAVVTDASKRDIKNGTDYTFYLDVFGKIAYYEEGLSSKIYGILDWVWSSNSGSRYARVITNEGLVKEYQFNKDEKAEEAWAMLYDAKLAEKDIPAFGTTGVDMDDVQDRVISYTVNSSTGYLNIKSQEKPERSEASGATYHANSNRIGSIRMSDNSIVLDVSDYVLNGGDGDVGLAGSLVDDEDYKAFGYGQMNSDSSYRFVIITDGMAGINLDSPLAILSTYAETTDEDGTEIVQLSVYTKGEQKQLLLDPDEFTIDDVESRLGTGSAFLYAEKGGYVSDFEPIINVGGSYNDYIQDVFDAVGKNGFNDNIKKYGYVGTETDSSYLKKSGDYGYFVFGPVIDTRGGITIAEYDNGRTYVDDCESYTLDNNTYVYAYDYSYKTSARTSASFSSIFVSTPYDIFSHTENGAEYIDWNEWANDPEEGFNSTRDIYLGLLEIADNDVAAAYAILPPR